jgi:hypothetical protein
MKKRKKGHHLKTWAIRQSPEPRAIELEPEDLTISIRREEKDVLPIIGVGRWKRAPPTINGCEHRQTENRSNGHSICYCISSSILTTLSSTYRKDER